jgi:hypothetical protein
MRAWLHQISCHLDLRGVAKRLIGVRLLAHIEQLDPLVREMGRVSNGRVQRGPFFCHGVHQLYPALRASGFGRFRVTKQFALPMVVHRAAASPGFYRAIETACRRVGLTRLFGAPSVLLSERLHSMPSARG